MPAGAFAPTTPVRAAFDLENDGIAYLLTDTTYHILDIATRSFVGGGLRDELLPEAHGTALTTGVTIPAGHAGGNPNREGFIISGESVAYVGYIVRTTRLFVVENVVTEFGPDWSGALAPNRRDLRADWLDTANDDGWVTANPSDFCATLMPTVSTYQAFITSSSVHVYEAGACFEFVERRPFAAFPAFELPDAPIAREVSAAFFHQNELHVFVD